MNRYATLRVLGATLLGIAAGTSLVARAQTRDSENIRQFFTEMKQHAVDAEYDAELLESYTRSSMPWQVHSQRITEMTTHVNDLGRDFNTAKKLRAQGSEWQKDAIDQIEPLLIGMADHLSASINHLKDNHLKTGMQPWTEYVKGNRVYANQAAKLIRDYVDFGEAKAKSEALEQKLAPQG